MSLVKQQPAAHQAGADDHLCLKVFVHAQRTLKNEQTMFFVQRSCGTVRDANARERGRKTVYRQRHYCAAHRARADGHLADVEGRRLDVATLGRATSPVGGTTAAGSSTLEKKCDLMVCAATAVGLRHF